MTESRRLIPISELKPGMITSMDIKIQGKVLLAKGIVITQPLIEKLKNVYVINKVEVFLENDSDKVLVVKKKTVKELEKTFNEFSSNILDIFNDLSSFNTPDLDEVRKFSKRIQEELKYTGTVIKNIISYGSMQDPLYRHSVNVTAISLILGKWLGLNCMQMNSLIYSAILHDFGKTQMSKDILDGEGNLSPEDYETFKTHPVIGYHIIKQIPHMDPSIVKTVLMHHERADGSGYPLQAKEDKIPMYAKIIAIADTFDNVNSNRYSKEFRGPFDALKVIKDESLTKLDCNYSNVFLNHMVNYYIGEDAVLNDGRSCRVIQVQMNDLGRPLLLDDNGFIDLKQEKNLYVEKLNIS
jgi:putative nucleotidyltransferase with HDIG domain